MEIWQLYPLLVLSCILLDAAAQFSEEEYCPRIYRQIFEGCIPSNGTDAGKYEPQKDIHQLNDCYRACCVKENCNIVLFIKRSPNICYHVSCKSNKDCLPKQKDLTDNTQMVLVRPVIEDEDEHSWKDILDGDSFSLSDQFSQPSEGDEAAFEPMQPRPCEIGVEKCGMNEVCSRTGKHSRNGMCICAPGYKLDAGYCVKIATNKLLRADYQGPEQEEDEGKQIFMEGGPPEIKLPQNKPADTVASSSSSSSSKPLRHMDVSAVAKTVRLPENEVQLSAFTVPSEKRGEHYNYEWTLISKPNGDANTGTMINQNDATVKLSHLSEGLYKFKVSVYAPGAYGEAIVNVTVLPPKRINKLPVAIITPVSQIVKSPTKTAVLDGSSSTDDVKIVKWHWELQQGPLDYKPRLEDLQTLQLEDLVQPGNYTFKLTVTDTDGATNSTTANITVVMVKDYPPDANAGEDIIVYLPQNNVTLNGSLSRDDHGIASWEWTKSSSDQDKAVDMQNTRTPFLQLSNLEEGMYTFSLKVTDTSGQSSHADVHVFVKPPTHKPPTVDAGPNATVSLPQSWVLLDGSKSSGEVKIATWHWEEVRRPQGSNPVVFTNVSEPQTNVTDLTKGVYEFHLTVKDDNGNTNSGSVFITVTQNQNTPPKANAGGDQTVVLPANVVALNGTQSSDDLGIVKWEWTREPNSLAIGSVVGNSDTTSILMLTDVVPGRYVFRLKVTDEQGASSEDTVSIIVKSDPHRLDLVELTLNIEGEQLTKSQEDSLKSKLSLLLKDHSVIHIRELREEHASGRAQMVFFVEDKVAKTVMTGPSVVQQLKQKLAQDTGLLELSVANIQTDICQNNCSGHGVCEKASRLCLCEAFWMQNLLRKYFGDGESNCDWSILYVIVGLFTGVVVFAGGGWGIICLCQRAFSPRQRPRKRYTPVECGEEESMILRYSQDKIYTDSDSDSDVVFEKQRGKQNGDIHNNFPGRTTKNGIKMGRRIKT